MSNRFFSFLVISGCGWVLDILLTIGLVQLGVSPFVASLIGAGTAVTFVYVVSRLMVFDQGRIGGPGDYALYVVWQILAIAAASAAVALLAHGMAPLIARLQEDWTSLQIGLDALALASGIAKGLITPVTLLANFLFMRWLTGRHKHAAIEVK